MHPTDHFPCPGQQVDAFDVDAVNTWLVSFGYGYSAGIGRFGKPIFFVGRLNLSKLVEAYEESLIRSNASRLKQVIPEGARHWLEGAS